MLYVRYIHLTKAKWGLFVRDKLILSSERILQKDYYRMGSVAPPPKISDRNPHGAKANWLVVDCHSQRNSNPDSDSDSVFKGLMELTWSSENVANIWERH
jgi:hypothetical protein